MTPGRITKQDLAAARQELRENWATKLSPEVRDALEVLWRAMQLSAEPSLGRVRDAAQQLKTAHFAAGWSEAESMSQAIDLLEACLREARPQGAKSGVYAVNTLASMNAIADGFGLDLDGEGSQSR